MTPDSTGEAVPAPAEDPNEWKRFCVNHKGYSGPTKTCPTCSPQSAPDVTCEHGTALDVHCCNCHSGFIFDRRHECPAPDSPAPVPGECICADGEIALLNTPDPCCPAREHRKAAYVAAPVHGEPPPCPTCDGKGWISPDDAERGIQSNGDLFNAGYQAGTSAAGDRLRALIQQWRYEATVMRKGRGLAAAALHACADELEQAITSPAEGAGGRP